MKEHELYINSFWSAIQKLMRLSGEKNCRKGKRRSGVRVVLLLALTVFRNFNFSLTALKSIRAYSLLVLMFHMFSLSAQTLIKDSGADGKTNVIPLVVGQKVPDDFWTIEHLIYVDGDTIRKNLSEYKGKPLILDFWATWCGGCIANFSKIERIQRLFKGEINIFLINSSYTRDTFDKVNEKYRTTVPSQWSGNISTVILDDYLMDVFPHIAVPFYVWLSKGGVVNGFTRSSMVSVNEVNNFLEH